MKVKFLFIIGVVAFCGSLLSGCSAAKAPVVKDGAPTKKVDVSKIPNAIPKAETLSKYGNPPEYKVNGKEYYVLKSAKGYDKKGIGSWYGTKFHGQLTSTREPYNMYAMTAASTDLPLPTYAEVTDLENGKHIIVKVNDRGPFDKDRIIDLSYAAAKKLGYANKGTALVEVKAIEPVNWNQAKLAKVAKTPVRQPKQYLQIAAFRNVNAANRVHAKITKFIKEPVRIDPGAYKHKEIFRIQIGPITNAAENDRLQKLLEAHGFNRGMVVIE